MPKDRVSPTQIDKLLELAAAADRHAVAFTESIKALYNGVSDARAANDGRGPSGLVVHQAVEKIFARYAAGTPLSRVQRNAHPAFSTYKQQLALWLPALTMPAPLPAAPPPPPPASRAA
jgi:hypothetical protein